MAPDAGVAAGKVCSIVTAGKAPVMTNKNGVWNRVLEAWWARRSPLGVES